MFDRENHSYFEDCSTENFSESLQYHNVHLTSARPNDWHFATVQGGRGNNVLGQSYSSCYNREAFVGWERPKENACFIAQQGHLTNAALPRFNSTATRTTQSYIQQRPLRTLQLAPPAELDEQLFSDKRTVEQSSCRTSGACKDFYVKEQLAMTSTFCSPGNCGSRSKTNIRKRERNLSIGRAFQELRQKIPNLPESAKLSKKTVLQLASQYIRHLKDLLNKEDSESKTCSFAKENCILEMCGSPGISAKRSREEFLVDPLLVSKKRRKIDANQIQKEIQRYEKSFQSRRKKSLLFRNQSTNRWQRSKSFDLGHELSLFKAPTDWSQPCEAGQQLHLPDENA